MRYHSLADRYIVPAIGKKRLTRLTPADVRLMLARATATRAASRSKRGSEPAPVSARTLQQVHAVLRAMLAAALREELVARNVARLV